MHKCTPPRNIRAKNIFKAAMVFILVGHCG